MEFGSTLCAGTCDATGWEAAALALTTSGDSSNAEHIADVNRRGMAA